MCRFGFLFRVALCLSAVFGVAMGFMSSQWQSVQSKGLALRHKPPTAKMSFLKNATFTNVQTGGTQVVGTNFGTVTVVAPSPGAKLTVRNITATGEDAAQVNVVAPAPGAKVKVERVDATEGATQVNDLRGATKVENVTAVNSTQVNYF